ncbi:hypothetical protein FHR75_004196 [Kineococcus radiotolerans]|uniref:RES domain-containing protein n=1 Tax=Kineococcus radiotolerans TaxID=131568 RepID=A0A7W4TQT9_KINRA|nr:RES family NAD+ phosphorylase [Kineococcus radiotolerans]MBB2903354.1 hypothetical protein [Kineococcus radiotolerans]
MPPTAPSGTPVIEAVPAGTVFHRVHGTYPAHTFNPTPQPSRLQGGRFDSLTGDYAYTYLGEHPDAALAETICRDLPLGGPARLVPHAMLAGRRMSRVRTTRDLDILVLHGAALTQVNAPLALTKCDAGHYLTTRAWADTLRTWCPDVAGFRYRCRHDEDLRALVLFDDGPPAATSQRPARARGALATVARSTYALTSAAGLATTRRVLRAHNATLS